ncbi:MAG TPA: hypothetical protein VEG42_01620, partial [Thermoplasmata archaeon]|nr:hypothetical protein [Thermoplasmata archaeon]
YRVVPGRVEVRLAGPGALFDRDAVPAYPHQGPMVRPSVTAYLVQSMRLQRRSPDVDVVLSYECEPIGVPAESATRAQLASFFSNEAELAALERHVNRAEGIASLSYATPFVLAAGLVAALLYVYSGGVITTKDLLGTLVYLIFITIVWVMLWDPIEFLLFDSFFLRQKWKALRKLASANVRFEYPRSTGRRP